MNKKMIIAVVISLVIGGGLGFYSGSLYGKSVSVSSRTGLNRRPSMQQSADFSGGNIIKKDDTSITVQLRDGSSKIIFYSGTTKIMKSVSGITGDLVVGEQVTVSGAKNSDGSVTAQSIQIRPAAPTNQ